MVPGEQCPYLDTINRQVLTCCLRCPVVLVLVHAGTPALQPLYEVLMARRSVAPRAKLHAMPTPQ